MAPVAVPELSVVVVVLAGGPHLARCLEVLGRQAPMESRQPGAPPVEVIVPHDESLLELDSLRQRFPEVRFLYCAGRRTYAELRAAGVRAARGRLVAITEDQSIPPEQWCANIVAAHAQP